MVEKEKFVTLRGTVSGFDQIVCATIIIIDIRLEKQQCHGWRRKDFVRLFIIISGSGSSITRRPIGPLIIVCFMFTYSISQNNMPLKKAIRPFGLHCNCDWISTRPLVGVFAFRQKFASYTGHNQLNQFIQQRV